MKIPAPKIESIPIGQIKPWGRNPRKNHAVDEIARSMESFGYVAPIIVQADTYRILAGHGRFQALQKIGATEIPVIVVDIDDDRADLYTLADNKLSEKSAWDFTLMADLLIEMDAKNIDCRIPGFSDQELEQIANYSRAPESVGSQEVSDKKKVQCPQCRTIFST